MTRHLYDKLPPLAGLASIPQAARIGLSVDENVRRLVRYHWVARRTMSCLVAHLPAEPVWEVKCAFALHQWYCAQFVDALRNRISEMRSPAPSLDHAPDEALDAFLQEMLRANGTSELLTAIYAVLLPRLAATCCEHLEITNPLADQPTRHLLRHALIDLDDALAWGRDALGVVGRDTAWQRHLEAYLGAAGGIAGETAPVQDTLPPARGTAPFAPDFHPRRDERFHGQYHLDYPPHIVYNMPNVPPDERNLALLCKRTLEMDVPEMMASFISERDDESWEFHRDYSRQLWDEARHAMMGAVALESRGVDWKAELPLNVSFALRLNLHATPIERQVMLLAIEQSLMPGETGKRFEYETALAAGDQLSSHFHDYDWADEVLHAQIGRRMLKRDGISATDASEQAKAIHERTWAALDLYRHRDTQAPWWPAFVLRTLGHESAVARRPDLGAINIFSE